MKYDDFYRRRRSGFGRFYTHEQIDSMRVASATEVVRRIPFVRVTTKPFGGATLSTPRCRNVQVYIDGMRTPDGMDLVDQMNASQIEAMEFHRGVATLPPEASGNGCGALFVWTR